MSAHGSKKAVFYALGANLGIAVAKAIAALITSSGSMLAETIHSLADCSNQILLLVGMKRAERPPDPDFPLGYGKAVYFWSFVVAMLLFSVGGLFSVYEGFHKYLHPEPLEKAWIALAVLVVSIVLEGSSLMGCLHEIRKVRNGKTFMQWLGATRNSELMVILGEDVAALMGLTAAFVFVSASQVLDMPVLDAVGSMVIGVILIIVSIFLVIRMKALLIGRSADPEIQAMIKAHLQKEPQIKTVFNLITFQIGPYIMLAGKVCLTSDLTIEAACKVINRLEKHLKTEFPEIQWSFIEPDIED